jgi:hypothetical protein
MLLRIITAGLGFGTTNSADVESETEAGTPHSPAVDMPNEDAGLGKMLNTTNLYITLKVEAPDRVRHGHRLMFSQQCLGTVYPLIQYRVL